MEPAEPALGNERTTHHTSYTTTSSLKRLKHGRGIQDWPEAKPQNSGRLTCPHNRPPSSPLKTNRPPHELWSMACESDRRDQCLPTDHSSTADASEYTDSTGGRINGITSSKPWKLQLSRFEANNVSRAISNAAKECDVHPVWLGRYPMQGGW